RIVDDGPTALPSGILTAFETAETGALEHVGDAVLPSVGRGEAKFLSFALDVRTEIRRTDRGVSRTSLGTIVDGVLRTTVRSRHTFDYEITPPITEDRTVVVEETRVGGWMPAATDGVEDTPTHHRLRVVAPKGTTTKAALVLERTDLQTVGLSTLAPGDLLVRLRGLGNDGPALREAIDRLAAVVAEIDRAEAQKTRNQQEREKIVADQERLRANLQSVCAGTDLGRRYLRTLDTQENRLGDLEKSDRAAAETVAARRRDAEEIVATLKL
ncbi:MAG: hypothetical protein GX458_09390, partial [Phyllobacteriaceae bacterium]|nr:hypothetical protein [Phyllobacteriaceae bacterium]